MHNCLDLHLRLLALLSPIRNPLPHSSSPLQNPQSPAPLSLAEDSPLPQGKLFWMQGAFRRLRSGLEKRGWKETSKIQKADLIISARIRSIEWQRVGQRSVCNHILGIEQTVTKPSLARALRGDPLHPPAFLLSQEVQLFWQYLTKEEGVADRPIQKQAAQIVEKFRSGLIRRTWIVKPAYSSKGRNILCTNNPHSLLTHALSLGAAAVVQLYQDQPLLFRLRKFDLRQWMLVRQCPLGVWVYEQSYGRVCGQEYDRNQFRQKGHLSNHSINREGGAIVSEEEIAEVTKIQRTLLRELIQRIVLKLAPLIVASLPKSDRKNDFQLLGLDILLAQDFTPYLIEINSSPSVEEDSRVLAELVPRMQEGLLQAMLNEESPHFKLLINQRKQ